MRLMTLSALSALLLCPAAGLAQTAFTYQGQLNDAGVPVNGTVNLDASLWDAADAGNQIGATVNLVGVSVVKGLFTAQLDFGAARYNGAARWLSLTVNGTPLTPRQELTPSPYAIFAQKPWVTSGADVSYNEGKVGIGTAAPMSLLHLGGTPGVDGVMFPDGTLQITAAVGTPGGVWALNGTSTYYNAGKVGIGRNDPPYALSFANVVGDKISLYGDLGGTYGFGIQGGLMQIHSNNASADIALGYGQSISFTERMRIKGNGNVGIGTASPLSKLDIAGIGDGLQLLRLSTERPWSFRQKYSGPGTALQLIPDTGLKNFEISAVGGANVATFVGDDAFPRVGINTTNPTSSLHSVSTLSNASGVYGQSIAGTAVAGVFGRSDASNGNGVIGEAPVGSSAYGVWGKATQGIGGVFSGGTLALWAQGRARVGILEITGGSDFSENFDVVNASGADADAKPGMIVCIDPKAAGKLVLSHRSYDPTVAGVISGAGGVEVGMTMGQEGTLAHGKHPVALTGRVYAFCDATTGAIQPGDLLTTSDTPGHAMKSSDRERSHGTVIGKAMTGLVRDERGLVLVLVNLQ